MKALFACVLASSLAVPVWACSCIAPGAPQTELGRAAAVFLAKATKVTRQAAGSLRQRQTVDFELVRTWKGTSARTLRIETEASAGTCGFPFHEGTRYLVYAHQGSDGKLDVTSCSRTCPESEAAQDLQALGAGNAPG